MKYQSSYSYSLKFSGLGFYVLLDKLGYRFCGLSWVLCIDFWVFSGEYFFISQSENFTLLLIESVFFLGM